MGRPPGAPCEPRANLEPSWSQGPLVTKEEKLPESVPGGYCLVAIAKAFQAERASPRAVCHTRGRQLALGGPLGGGGRAGRGAGVPQGPRAVLSRPPHKKAHLPCAGAALGPACHGERHRQMAAREPLCTLTRRLCSPASEVSPPVALGQKPFVSVWPWLGFWGKRREHGPRAVAGALGGGQWGPQV